MVVKITCNFGPIGGSLSHLQLAIITHLYCYTSDFYRFIDKRILLKFESFKIYLRISTFPETALMEKTSRSLLTLTFICISCIYYILLDFQEEDKKGLDIKIDPGKDSQPAK